MFLALQVVLLLLGAGLSVVSVRLGVAVWLALAAQFTSFMWMTVPALQLSLQATVFGALYFAAGVTLAWSHPRMRWWALPTTTLAVFGLLRLVMWFYWLAKAPISGVSLATLWNSTLVLVGPATAGLILAHVVMVMLRRPAIAAPAA